MAITTARLLKLLASIDARWWGIVNPPQPPWVGRVIGMGPFPRPWRDGPSPDPWRDGPVPDPWRDVNGDFQLQVQIATRDVVRRIADAAAAASAQGGDGAAVIERAVDEWVSIDDGDGTGKIPLGPFFPGRWWFDPPRPPRPNELVELVPALAAAAWSFSAIGDTIRDPSIKDAIDGAVDRLVERAARSLRESGFSNDARELIAR